MKSKYLDESMDQRARTWKNHFVPPIIRNGRRKASYSTGEIVPNMQSRLYLQSPRVETYGVSTSSRPTHIFEVWASMKALSCQDPLRKG